jgi:hypothetical protein
MFKKILLIVTIFILFYCFANLIISAANKSKKNNNTELTKQNKTDKQVNKNIVEIADEGYDDPSYY